MNKFKYEKLFQFNKDNTKYTKLKTDPIKIKKIDGKVFIIITKNTIEKLAKEAFYNISHYLRPDHLKQISSIFSWMLMFILLCRVWFYFSWT